jgi:hypothetical protein
MASSISLVLCVFAVFIYIMKALGFFNKHNEQQ